MAGERGGERQGLAAGGGERHGPCSDPPPSAGEKDTLLDHLFERESLQNLYCKTI